MDDCDMIVYCQVLWNEPYEPLRLVIVKGQGSIIVCIV